MKQIVYFEAFDGTIHEEREEAAAKEVQVGLAQLASQSQGDIAGFIAFLGQKYPGVIRTLKPIHDEFIAL